MYLNNATVYALVVVAVEVLFLLLLFIFSSEEEWITEQQRKGTNIGCYECINLCSLPHETMALFVSRSTTQKWSSEYGIVVILQRNRAMATRIIDMSYLQYDVKNIIREYEESLLHMSLSCSASGRAVAVKAEAERIKDSDKVAEVILKLLQNSVKTDLHKIPVNGVRILYATVQSY